MANLFKRINSSIYDFAMKRHQKLNMEHALSWLEYHSKHYFGSENDPYFKFTNEPQVRKLTTTDVIQTLLNCLLVVNEGKPISYFRIDGINVRFHAIAPDMYDYSLSCIEKIKKLKDDISILDAKEKEPNSLDIENLIQKRNDLVIWQSKLKDVIKTNITIDIETWYPGRIIGKEGTVFDELRTLLIQYLDMPVEINLKECQAKDNDIDFMKMVEY